MLSGVDQLMCTCILSLTCPPTGGVGLVNYIIFKASFQYCFFYIIINNDILQRALQSVTKNCKTILTRVTIMLGIFFEGGALIVESL